jgi:flagellar P-ring protein precursor FlgI
MIFGSIFRIVRSRAVSFCCAVALTLSALPASAQSVRIKDIADFEGIRDNMLVGYGIVAGLAGTGDDLSKVIFTRESLLGMLERLGVNARTTNANGSATNELRTKNIATVMVTATLPPFARQGTRLDVQVSAMGDAQSLLGGVLLVTPMMGADGEVYAVAQGPMAISGFRAQGQASTLQRGVPTSGRISNGAIVEREVGFEMASLENVRLTLRNPDLTTARRVAQAVNSFVGAGAARPADPSTINIQVPAQYKGDVVAMLTDIERLPIEPDKVAKVVIDERSGVIVMGENVRISTVAVAQANLTIRVTETPQVSQPGPFAPGATGFPGQLNADQVINVPQPRVGADGRPVLDAAGNPIFDMVPQVVPGSRQGGALGGGAQTVVVPRTSIEVDDQSGRRLAMVPSGVTLGELVNGLNALGVGPRDLITILQAIKAAGALQADIEIM